MPSASSTSPSDLFVYLSAKDLPVPDAQTMQAFHALFLDRFHVNIPIDLALDVAEEIYGDLIKVVESSRRVAQKKVEIHKRIRKHGMDSLAPDEKMFWAAMHPDC